MKTESRRIEMKKQTLSVGAALLFLLGSAAGSYCQDQPARRPRVRENMIQWLLDLSPEQMDSMNKLRVEHQKERIVLMDQINLLDLEIRQMMRDPEANISRLKELRRQIFDLREALFDQGIAHRKARNSILTPEQLEKMKSLESRRFMDQMSGRRVLTPRGDRAGFGSRIIRPRSSRFRETRPYDQRRTDPRLKFRRY